MNTTAQQPSPQVMDAMYKIRQGDNEAALAIVEEALGKPGDEAALRALAGLAAQRMGDAQRALPHLQRLLELKPSDVAAKVNLANAHIALGNPDDALILTQETSDPRLLRVKAYVLQEKGQLDEAAALYRQCVEADENDLAAWNNLGNVMKELGRADEAIGALERAISLAPRDLPIYLNLAEVLREHERVHAQVKVLEDAREFAPTELDVLLPLGNAYAEIDRLDDAIDTLNAAIAISPDPSDAQFELAKILESYNRGDKLAELLDTIDLSQAADQFGFLAAWKAQREGDLETAAAFVAAIPENVHAPRRFHLAGTLADRLGDERGAFEAFERMNKEAEADSPAPEGPSYRDLVDRDSSLLTPEWVQNWSSVDVSDGNRDPIFLVGFPRSGTTLLDTILMGQGDLSVLEERPMLARTKRLLDIARLPELAEEEVRELRQFYFANARQFGWDETKWLVDKHPLNMQRVPLIHRLFPKAKIILAERHPYDAVFSCFMANFQLNLAMRSFTTLEETARTYDAVFTSWTRATQLLPVDHHAVRYERLVADARAELAPLIDWLGLEWSDAMLDHTTTARDRGRVRTASYSQIGEEIYTRSTDRWRRYEDRLQGVIPILEPWGRSLGYEA